MRRRLLFTIILLLLLFSAAFGLFMVGKYTGYVASHRGLAGYIYEVLIEHRLPNYQWAGVYGVAVRIDGYMNQAYEDFSGGDMEETNLLFDCLEPRIEHEVYASIAGPGEIDWSFLYPATPQEVDAWLGTNPNASDTASRTYTQSILVQFGSQTIIAPGTYTYSLDPNRMVTFSTAILKDGLDHLVFVSQIVNFTQGFNGRIYNYQVLLPIITNTTQRYYFYRDPNDLCPAGEGGENPLGTVIGNVTDTSGVRLANVIVDIAGHSTLTDGNGHYELQAPAGNYRIYAIKEGYQPYYNNLTVVEGATTVHDIVLVPQQEPNSNTGPGTDNPGDSSGVGPGQTNAIQQIAQQQGGAGEAIPTPSIEQPIQIAGTDFIVSLSDLKRKLRQGTFLQESIYVFSFKKSLITVTFLIDGNASDLIDFDTSTLQLEPNENGKVVLTIFGREEVGVYNGTLVIGGDINASVPVEIEILPKDQLPVEALHIQLETSRKEVLPGDEIRFKTDLRNLLIDRPYTVRLFYTIQPADGDEIVWSTETNVFLKTAFSVIKAVKLPTDLKAGDYVLRVTASYLGLGSSTSTIFQIKVPFWQRVLFGLRYWHWFLILFGLGLLALAVFLIRRNVESKKKYHLKVELSEIPGPGPRNIPVGRIAETNHNTYFNLESFKVHTIVAGSTGGGKSVSAQVIIEEALDKGVAVIAFDPTAQWTGMLRPCKDKTMLALYPLYNMKKTDAKAYNGNVRMILDAREKIDVMQYVKPGEIQVFCFHKLDPKDMDIVVANAIRSIFRSGPQENKPLKVMFVFDEVHRLLPKFGGSGDGFLQIERACREFRKWGLGVMLISQVLSDFVGTIKANINTEIQMRTRDEGDLERIRVKYGEDVLRSLVKATVGTGMVENPAYNRGKPYFVAFRPLKHSVERMTDEEIQKYNDYNDRLDNLYASLEQLEKENIDVFDLRLELKLALDKVKSGNFNMVDVYLEGLVPRIDKQWERLGKKPKKFERELVNLDDLRAELDKAKQERDKYVAEQDAKKGPAVAGEKKEIGWKDDVPPNKMLNLKNGMIVINLSSLFDEVSAMKDDDFAKHVNETKNDFAKWVYEAVGDQKLANAIAAEKEKLQILAVLAKKKNNEQIPDVKAPGWFLQQLQGTSAAAAAPPPAAPPATSAPGTPVPSATSVPGPVSAPPQSPQTPSAVLASTIAQEKVVLDQLSVPVAAPSQQTQSYVVTMPPVATLPPVTAVSARDLSQIVTQDPGKYFYLENGAGLKSLKELLDSLPLMDDGIFRNHVGDSYNHFADWIAGVFNEQDLAGKLRGAHDKRSFIGVLEKTARGEA